ncbi:GNAT family N-acetyltransferase [Aquitalea magnusonii]|uniref:GNAT family acetyltransferase n=1 Tax=Aquitalea magnusonii TaxID=332411 RepID=A0A318JIM5_9NEIS|nr:GNAT family N-acetyltransferase [Aquitalea magnusonii]PXX50664.1 GNAT family acetyltransferase [Aquitalea magnusonii]
MENFALQPEHLPDCHALLADCVANLPDDAYSLAARLAWAGIWDEDCRVNWEARLAGAWSVGLRDGDQLLAFAWLTQAGELDMLYVAPWAQGRGLARQMIQQLEDAAAAAGVTALHAWASHAARPVLEAAGYVMLRPNRVVRDGIPLENWLMAKGGWQEPAAARSDT